MAAEHDIKILVDQVELVRSGIGINDGELSLFRQALQMEGFSEIAQTVKSRFGRDLFSTLREIESMEEDFIYGNRSGLMVQCGLILELVMNNSDLRDERYTFFHQSPTFFDHCRDLEEIAMQCSRLNFVAPESELRQILSVEINSAVSKCLAHSAPTWRDMILILKTAVLPQLSCLLFMQFEGFIADESFEVPALAATLLLSFLAEALRVHDLRRADTVAGRLLALGASPMVTVDDHRSIFERIHARYFRDELHPWWLEAQEPELESVARGPTALRRLMEANKSPDLRLALEQYSCCNLDSIQECTMDFPSKVVSLRCMAARRLRVSDLELLSGRLKFCISKHIPSPR